MKMKNIKIGGKQYCFPPIFLLYADLIVSS